MAELKDLVSPAPINRCGNREFPVLSMTMHDGIMMQNERFKKSLASIDQSAYKVVKRNQLVVGFPIDEGVLYIQRAADAGIMSPAYDVWDVDQSKVDLDYLELSLHSPQAMLYYKTNLRGTTARRRSLPKGVLLALPIHLPALAEQLKIVETIKKVKSIILLHKQQLQKLDDLIKARFVEMFGMPGTDTKGWGLIPIGKCTEINPKKGLDARLKSGLRVSFIPMPAVSENGVIDASESRDYDDVRTGFTYFVENDVLFAKITPCMENGKGAVATGLINGIGFGSTEFHVLRPLAGISNPYWLYVLTSFESFRKDAAAKMTGSAGQRRVPASFFDHYKVTLPPIMLQEQFATFVAQVDKSKAAVQKALDEAQLLFDSLMQKYFG